MNLVNASLSQFLASGGILRKIRIFVTLRIQQKGSAELLSFPPPLFFFIFYLFFLKLGVIHFREHKVYILTETGVQKLPGPQKQLAR